MNQVYICGFNGFRQIQVLEKFLQSFSFVGRDSTHRNESPKHPSAAETKEEKGKIRSTDPAAADHTVTVTSRLKENDGNLPGPQIKPDTSLSISITDKMSGESESELETKNNEDCGKDPAQGSESFCLLKKVGMLSDRHQIKHVEMTWSRIALTLSTGTTPGENTPQDHHSLVCGFSNKEDGTSGRLCLRLSDCQLKASGQSDFVLQASDQLLLLTEESNKVRSLSVKSEGGIQPDSSAPTHTFGAVSGMATEFVVCYDGISLGKLSKYTDQTETDRTVKGNQTGDRLWMTLSCIDSGLQICAVSCGLEHALLLTQHGSVLSYGSGSRGQLGQGLLDSLGQPTAVSALEGVSCIALAAGGWHSAAVTECGDLYMWGWNESGQLGLPCPALTSPAGGGDKTAASLYPWPQVVHIGNTGDVLADGEDSLDVRMVACGSRHTIVLTDEGRAFSTGWNKYGQLGLPHIDSLDRFTPILPHRTDHTTCTITQLYCGAWNSLFVVTEQ